MNPISTNFDFIHDLNIMRLEHKINTASNSFTPPVPPNLPCANLLYGNREDYINVGVPLYKASITGDWQTAKAILHKHPELVRFGITENYETALHVAALAEDTKLMEDFVQNLVNMMEKNDLELQNKNYNTALSLAAAAGSVKMAQIMVNKNHALLDIPGSQGMLPLYFAALFEKDDMVKYLYANSRMMSGHFWTDENRGWVVVKCAEAEIFDVAIQILEDRPELAVHRPTVLYLLHTLSRNAYAFNISEGIIWRIIFSIYAIIRQSVQPVERQRRALKLLRMIWGNIMKLPMSDIDDILKGPFQTYNNQALVPNRIEDIDFPSPLKSTYKIDFPSPLKSTYKNSLRILFLAAEMGNTRFIFELIQAYPDLIWKVDDDNHSIFHIAVMHRHPDIYNLLYEIGSMKDFITPLEDQEGNNMLHLVGKTAAKMRTLVTSQASLLIQRELLWFKEVEKMLPPAYRKKYNKMGETPYELFYKSNEYLVREGLNWVDYSMVVATLIITVAFAVAFAIPGGYNQNNGFPMFMHKRIFIAFVIADSISLFSSSASVFVFLSVIIYRRRNEQHFMESLPKKLMIGLVTLFISITAMMVTFSISLFVLYHKKLKWVPILIGVLAAMPVLLFGVLQYPLLVDMFRSIYDSRYLFKPKKRMLYIQTQWR